MSRAFRVGTGIRVVYEFDRYRLDAVNRTLRRDGDPVAVTFNAFEVLLALVEAGGQIVEKETLLRRVWADTFVDENNLAQNISALRKILGPTRDAGPFIETVPKRGYRFVPPVQTATAQPSPAPVEHPAEAVPEFRRRITKQTAAVLGAVILLLAGGFAVWRYAPKRTRGDAKPVATNLTSSGNVVCSALSPDGRYLAYATVDQSDLTTIALMQVATLSAQPILPPTERRVHALNFSPDGQFIFFVSRETPNAGPTTLFRMPLLGGPPTRVRDGVDSGISFSPDGRRFVFRRALPDRGGSILAVANADGTDEQRIAALSEPEDFGEPAWSPDGKTIACAAGHEEGGRNRYVLGVSVGDWNAVRLTPTNWSAIGQVVWGTDTSTLLMTAVDRPADPMQVWKVTLPGGEAERLTNDTTTYNRLGFAAATGALAVRQVRFVSDVWIVPYADPRAERRITFGTGGHRGMVSWTPDGKVLYDSQTGASFSISVMDRDGGNQRRLIGEPPGTGNVLQSTASPDGRFVVFASDRTGRRNLWRIDRDGTNPRQLTDGDGEDSPTVTPDGKFVVYRSFGGNGGKSRLWKVGIDGGPAIKLSDVPALRPAVSPDGKFVAAFIDYNGPTPRLALFPIEGGPPITVFSEPIVTPLQPRWTPDGTHIAYIENRPSSSKIRLQPVAGGPSTVLATFDGERTFGFDFSRDGKELVCIRGIWATNVVLIREAADK